MTEYINCGTQKCSKCLKEKAITKFRKVNQKKDSWCTECRDKQFNILKEVKDV